MQKNLLMLQTKLKKTQNKGMTIMKKKTIIPLLLSFAILCSFSACSKEKPTPETSSVESTVVTGNASVEGSPAWAYAQYQKAIKDAEKYSGKNIYLTGTIENKSTDGVSQTSLDIDFRSQEKKQKKENELDIAEVQYTDHMIAEIVKDGETNSFEVYYANGVRYYSDSNGKYCQTIDRQSAIPELSYFMAPTLTEAAFNTPILASDDEFTEISLPIRGDMISSQLLEADGPIHFILGDTQDNLRYTFGDATVKLILNKKGQLAGYDLYYTVSINDLKKTNLSVSFSMEYKTPGKNIEVKLPSFKGYKEMYSSVLNKEAYNAMPTIVDALFDANGKRVKDYETAYKTLCKKYGKTIVDSVVAWFEKQL